jgi:uridine kinase
MIQRAFVVGIAGPSCSGKTSLARRLHETLDGTSLVFELDWYYRDQRGRSLDDIDVDIPEALDDALIVDQLRHLAAGLPIDRPVYDYVTHARLANTVRVDPSDVVIVEGLFALYWEPLRRLLGASVFITADHATCLSRRIARDTHERGRAVEEVMRQYHRSVRPRYEKFVQPTARYADLVLSGSDPVDSLAERVARLIAGRGGGSGSGGEPAPPKAL